MSKLVYSPPKGDRTEDIAITILYFFEKVLPLGVFETFYFVLYNVDDGVKILFVVFGPGLVVFFGSRLMHQFIIEIIN